MGGGEDEKEIEKTTEKSEGQKLNDEVREYVEKGVEGQLDSKFSESRETGFSIRDILTPVFFITAILCELATMSLEYVLSFTTLPLYMVIISGIGALSVKASSLNENLDPLIYAVRQNIL